MYRAGGPVRDIPIQSSVNVPAGCGIGTSLTPISPYDPRRPAGGMVHYAAATVEMLEDSPILTGIYFREYPLAPELTPKYYVDVVGDSAEVVEIRPSVLEDWNRPIPEA
jgi:Peptidase M61 N-terminal domain